MFLRTCILGSNIIARLFSVEKAKKAMLAHATFVPLQKKKSKLDMPMSASSQFGRFALLSMR